MKTELNKPHCNTLLQRLLHSYRCSDLSVWQTGQPCSLQAPEEASKEPLSIQFTKNIDENQTMSAVGGFLTELMVKWRTFLHPCRSAVRLVVGWVRVRIKDNWSILAVCCWFTVLGVVSSCIISSTTETIHLFLTSPCLVFHFNNLIFN